MLPVVTEIGSVARRIKGIELSPVFSINSESLAAHIYEFIRCDVKAPELFGLLVQCEQLFAAANNKNYPVFLTDREDKTACLCPIVKKPNEFIQKKNESGMSRLRAV